jgi:iron complex outermembrane receptor protein
MPLLGATIIVEGTSNGATTDFDGNYLLNVKKENAVLVFFLFGV